MEGYGDTIYEYGDEDRSISVEHWKPHIYVKISGFEQESILLPPVERQRLVAAITGEALDPDRAALVAQRDRLRAAFLLMRQGRVIDVDEYGLQPGDLGEGGA